MQMTMVFWIVQCLSPIYFYDSLWNKIFRLIITSTSYKVHKIHHKGHNTTEKYLAKAVGLNFFRFKALPVRLKAYLRKCQLSVLIHFLTTEK